MSLDELATRQQATGKEIIRLTANYRKDPIERKTPDYLATRLKDLEHLWGEFEAMDNEIRINYEADSEHAYFEKNYYEQIRTGYEKVREDILAKIQENQGQNAATRPPKTGKDKPSAPKNTGAEGIKAKDETGASIMQKQSILNKRLQRLLAQTAAKDQVRSPQSFQLKIQAIEGYWREIKQLRLKITNQFGEEYSTQTLEEYLNLEEQTHEALIELHEGMSRCQAEASHNASHSSAEISTRSAMKLPKIELPKFDGDYIKWRQFRDLFTELVHNQPIATCQKMWYLKGSLSGEAERLVRHLTTSEANYDVAWKIINERYENTRLLVSALLNKLLSQQTIAPDSAMAIRNIHDTTQECLLALSNLNVNTDSWDPLVLHILLKRLDKATRMMWEQSLQKPKSLQSLSEFLEFLETRFQSLEAFGNSYKTGTKSANLQRSLTATVKTGCLSCHKDSHQLYACKLFLELPILKRISLVKRMNACLNCLKNGHNLTNCPSRGCTKCGRKHNTLLHMPISGEDNTIIIKA